MDQDEKFNNIVSAASWKKKLNISFMTSRYIIKIESVAYLPRQTAIVAKHDHMMYKLRYFPSGSGIVGIGENAFSVMPDTFLMIAPLVSHYQIHSYNTSAEEYTVFLEIIPNKIHEVQKNELIYNDFDSILDIITSKPYYFGKDTHSAGFEMLEICRYLMQPEEPINLSQLWVSILQLIIASAHNIKELPRYNIDAIPSNLDEQRISILDNIFRTYHEEMSQENAAMMLGISVRHLNRITMRYYNLTFKQKYMQSRMELASTLLEKVDSLSINEISQKLNFSTASYFSKVFKKYYGVSPCEYRKKQAVYN